MVRTRRLTEFVDSFVQNYNEDQEDKAIWEMWLHKVFDQSYADFKGSLSGGNRQAAPTQEDIAETVRDSMGILSGFAPDERVGGRESIQAVRDNSG